MKKDLKKSNDLDWKQEIAMHFCGHVFSVVTDKYLLNGSILIADILKNSGNCNFL